MLSSSPLPRLFPPISPRRPPSPMSPGTRKGRGQAMSDESHLRDLSPETTLRAFTQNPMPYDTSIEEYKIFACIETLTAAERDLGARVAKAAQRLQSWCQEIQQWGWSGTFEQPSDEYKERRRRSLELRIREHTKEEDVSEKLPPLEYWGSLLSVEVKAHEARLDEISDHLIELDIEELKGHVLEMHPGSKSRPSSAGYGASRNRYTPVDDFNFLITQTLLSALPHHFQLKERLSTWTARVTVLCEAPRYLRDLRTAQNAMQMGWKAVEPPTDSSDSAFNKWKGTIDTISGVLRDRVGDLGRRLDRMLDTLEGHEDCLPDNWIDIFESVENDFGRWTHDSRRRMLEFDLRRHTQHHEERTEDHDEPVHSELPLEHAKSTTETSSVPSEIITPPEVALASNHVNVERRSPSPLKTDFSHVSRDDVQSARDNTPIVVEPEPESPADDSIFEEGDTVIHNELEESSSDAEDDLPQSTTRSESPIVVKSSEQTDAVLDRPQTPHSRRGSIESISSSVSFSSTPPKVAEESPSVRKSTNQQAKAPRPALNAAMSKRRGPNTANEQSVDSAPPWPPTQFAHKTPTSAEDLDRKISDILTTIPAHIRLTSSSRADLRDLKSPRGVTNKGSKGYLRAARSVSGLKSPELTLSPVKQDFDSANVASGRRSTAAMRGDNEIKLYHLTQPGREHPIKLFIRRVGENGERVMVRVGGGWADLGEYLRQYAEHHGRRAVSDGKFEILGLEVKDTALSPNRPESAMSKRDRRFSGGTQTGSPNTTPIKSGKGEVSNEEAPPPMPNFTPTQTGSNETSAPSTGSSRVSWQGNEVGLAGPNTKKLDLSNEKLEWIEGMMKQARTVSGNISQHNTPNQQSDTANRTESRSESRSENRAAAARKKQDFGDLGKVGGTKRIFMRGGGLGEH